MVDAIARRKIQLGTSDQTRYSFRRALWLLVCAAALLVTAALLWSLSDARTFWRAVAENSLGAAVVVVGAAVLASLLQGLDARRDEREQDRRKRLELLVRLRAAHVRISHARRVMRAENNPRAYEERMRDLMLVVPELEEIREEVKASTGLYEGNDKTNIMGGIAQIVEFLDAGYREYTDWCRLSKNRPDTDPRRGPWLARLVDDWPPPSSKKTMDPEWAPQDSMPPEYDAALSISKAKMREYIYGAEVADMLYEDDVVDAVCRYLEHNGYVIRQSLTSVQRGHDIIADKRVDPTWTLYVEAKGEGSSKATTARYGSSFNSGQVFDHVAKAVLKALRVASWDTTEPQSRAGIALPENAAHVQQVEMVGRALRNAGVAVFWVDQNKRVHVESPWPI
jgi:hypothetical protein